MKPSLAYAYTEPVREFARKRGISPTKVYDWINSGQIESFLEGKRRHVVVASYDRLVRRRVAEQRSIKLPSSNPKAKARRSTASDLRNAAAPSMEPQGPATAPPKRRGTTARG